MPIDKKSYSIFSRRLTEARDAKGLTQQELGDRVGIASLTVSKYERIKNEKVEVVEQNTAVMGRAQKDTNENRPSKAYPTLDVAGKIADTLEVSLDWLIGKTNEKKSHENEDISMLYYIADIMDKTGGKWEANCDLCKLDYDENKIEKQYAAAICTTDRVFGSFISDYSKALHAGNSSMEEYGIPKEVADSMKMAVLTNYIDLLTRKGKRDINSCSCGNSKEEKQ